MRTLICIVLTMAVSALAAGGAPAATATSDPTRDVQDLEKLELLLHGAIAVHAATVIAMDAYTGGVLTKEQAQREIDRNEKFLAVLIKVGERMKRQIAIDERGDISFLQDYLQVCNYLNLALDAFKSFADEGREVDEKLFDRYIAKGEEAMNRLLESSSEAE